MSDIADDVRKVVHEYLETIEKLPESFDDGTALYADGADIDSLETAELSAILEDTFGHDPYAAGLTPESVGQIVSYYREHVPSSL